MSPNTSVERKCVEYFQEFPVFMRLFRGFRKKYDSYSEFAGKVELRGLKSEDREALEGFFQKSFHGKKSCVISAEQFSQALLHSAFAGISPVRVLELCLGEELKGKREILRDQEKLWKEMLMEVENSLPENEIVKIWFQDRKAELIEVKYFSEEKTIETRRQLLLEGSMVEELPAVFDRRMYLPVYAALVTGNPHAFDSDMADGRLLDSVVRWYWGLTVEDEDGDAEAVFSAFLRQRQYLQAGILLDDVSNYVMISGIHARRNSGVVHAGMEGFCRDGEMVFVPLAVLADWESVSCPDREIHIVENPSIFAMLCSDGTNRACMCMNGQPRLSSLVLLQLLARSGVSVYYSGDLDPEGLLIADKLKRFYLQQSDGTGEFHFWRMTEDDYEKCRSEVEISDRRIKMLDRLQEEELIRVAERIRSCRRAGYQENLEWRVEER